MADHRARETSDRPRHLPWPVLGILIFAFGVIFASASLLFGAAAAAAVPGFIAGFFGALASPRRRVPLYLLAGAVAAAVLSLSPERPVLFGMAIALSGLAGHEAVRTGGQSAILALFMVVALHLVPSLPPPETALWPVLYGMAAAWGLLQLTPLAGAALRPPATLRFGVGLALFLSLGLGLSILAMHHVREDFAHWLALLFVLRALAPEGQVVASALRFGLGAALGSVAALGLVMLVPAGPGLQVLAIAILIGGLRYAPHPGPLAPAAFSAAVLLLTAPSVHNAVFRIEATLFAVALCTGLATLLSAGWAALDRAGSHLRG